jgi:hypothetical protein
VCFSLSAKRRRRVARKQLKKLLLQPRISLRETTVRKLNPLLNKPWGLWAVEKLRRRVTSLSSERECEAKAQIPPARDKTYIIYSSRPVLSFGAHNGLGTCNLIQYARDSTFKVNFKNFVFDANTLKIIDFMLSNTI